VAQGPPDKAPIPDRVREPLSGAPKNAELQAAILERARAQLVKRYRRNSGPWPDGIDTEADRWYGDGSGWTEERLKAALSDAVFEGAVVKVGRPRLEDRDKTLTAKEPWKAEGMSKATWYRHRQS
jgi:hypothetical protein